MVVYDKIKKGLFGKKLIGKVDDKEIALKMPRGSKVSLELQDKGFIVKKGKTPITSVYSELWFDEKNPNIMFAQKDYYSGYKMKIDCKTGNHTPECKKIIGDYAIDTDENILKIDEKLNTTPTGLIRVDYDYHANFIVCKNENGKYIVVDSTSFKQLIDKEFDTPKITSSLKLYNNNEVVLKCISVDNKHYFIDENGKQVMQLEGTEIKNIFVGGEIDSKKNVYITCYDEKTNKTNVVVYNKMSEEINESFAVDDKIVEAFADYQKCLFVTENKQQKQGVVDKLGVKVIPHEYDEVSSKRVGTRYNDRYLFMLKNGNKMGIADTEGKIVLPVEYDDIDFRNSGTYQSLVRFFAKKGEYYGVVNSNGKVEADFIYDHNPSFTSVSPFYLKGERPSDNKRGLEIKNTKTGEKDYLTINTEKSVYKNEEVERYHYSSEPEKRKVKKTIEVDKYDESEIVAASVFHSILFDSPIAGLYTAGYMKDQKETKTIEVEEDGPSNDY